MSAIDPGSSSLTAARDVWPLVGRDDELSYLLDTLRSHPHGLVITGPLGVGKSRLASTLTAELAADGWAVSTHFGTQARSQVPFAAFASLVAGGLAPEADPLSRILAAADHVAQTDAAQVAIQVDDAHWLDDESLAFLQHLAETSAATLVLTARSPHDGTGHVLEQARTLGLGHLHLHPLSRAEVSALLHEVLPELSGGEVQRLWDLSQGNPLYLRQLVHRALERGALVPTASGWALPDFDRTELADVVDARIDDLGGECREALELLTVGGSIPVAALPPDFSSEQLIDLERRGLVLLERSGRRAVARLSHPLYAEVIGARMGPAARRERRRHLLDHLEDHGSRRAGDLVQSAVWRLEQGDEVDPATLLAVARRLAGQFVEPDVHAQVRPSTTEGGLLELAARLARAASERGGGFEATDLWFQIEAHTHSSSTATAEALARLGEEIGTEEHAARVLVSACGLQLLNGWASAPEIVAELEDVQRTVTSSTGKRSVDAYLALTLFLSGNPVDAEAAGRRARSDPATSARDRLVAAAPLIGGLTWLGRTTEALALADEAIGEVGADADQWVVGGLVLARLNALACHGRIDETFEQSRQLLEVAEAIGNHSGIRLFALAKAQAALAAGRPEDAVEAAHRVLRAQTDRAGQVLADDRPPFVTLAHAHAYLGQAAAAKRWWDRAARLPARTETFHAQARRAEAWMAAANGRHATAIAALGRAVEDAGRNVASTITCLHDLTRLGEVGVAARMQAAIEANGGVDGALWPAYVAHAAALDDGDGALLDAASTTLAELGHTLEAAEAAAQAAGAHAAAGSRAAAAASTARSRALAADCQGAATPALVIAEAGSAQLSKRELECARLAARGWSDKEIADELVLSVRTVHSHLYRAYAKLGVTSRGELADHPSL